MQTPAQQAHPIPPEVQYLYNKEYKDVEMVNEQQYFGKIRKALDLLPADDKFFKTIQSLLKFFKFPFLLLLKNPIDRIVNQPDLLAQREGDLKKIAKIAHDMIGPGGKIYELNFLFQRDIDTNFYKKIEIKQEKRKFIQYLKNLSECKKRLQGMIDDKTITQDDILKFQSMSFGKDLKYLDELNQNAVRKGIKDIEIKCEEIKKEKRKQAKKQMESRVNSREEQETTLPRTQPPTQAQKPTNKQQQDLQDIPVCCRRSFYHRQIIYQPQSINFVYRHYQGFFRQQNHFDILKTICGLLNSEGGFLFIGIREDKNTYKKEVEGYTVIEKDKVEFKNIIEELVDKCIQPTVAHDSLRVLFVPLKSRQGDKFISGKFLIKICVRFGQRKEFYSFKQSPDSKKENFAVRTDNDTKIIYNSQEVLNIYRNRVLQTPPDPKPLHSEPCPKPEVGRPLYEIEEIAGGGRR